ncbi:MAG: peptide ABC transporter permease [Gammaproteobacteria bacterium]|nr:MAG: peptide ABC transporter permease [Gammaproteobacteria bacterium]
MSPGRGQWRDAWRRLRRHRPAMAALVYLAVLGAAALLAPHLAPYAYDAQDLALGATPPSAAHWFGTDVFGRDLFTRVLYGARVSLLVGLVATAVALCIGVLWGTVAGYLGGRVDAVMMRIVDILYGLPFILFVILLLVVFGRHLVLLFLAIGAVEWLTMARIVRAQVMSLRHQEFVLAARSMGFSTPRILFRHIVPNTWGPVIVYTTLTIPNVILLESFLSFLGLGVQPPAASWGLLISHGVESMEAYPWLLLFPALALFTTLLALNTLGDGLRDALDPKTAGDAP